MKTISFILNLPWTVCGFIGAILSLPVGLTFSKKPFAFVFKVKSFWWYNWQKGMKGIRGMANGSVVQLGPTADEKDLAHELVHVEQYQREPFVHLFRYWNQSRKFGYRNNKYEVEAYGRAGNIYKEN